MFLIVQGLYLQLSVFREMTPCCCRHKGLLPRRPAVLSSAGKLHTLQHARNLHPEPCSKQASQQSNTQVHTSATQPSRGRWPDTHPLGWFLKSTESDFSVPSTHKRKQVLTWTQRLFRHLNKGQIFRSTQQLPSRQSSPSVTEQPCCIVSLTNMDFFLFWFWKPWDRSAAF